MKARLPDKNSNLEQLEKFSNVDLIITDLDGTVIGGSKPILEQIKDNINYLQQRCGVRVTVATGRTYFGALPVMKELKLKDGVPIAIYNGGIVMGYGTDQVYDKRTIDRNIVGVLQNYLEKVRDTIYVYTFEISKAPFVRMEKNYTCENVYGLGHPDKEFDSNGMKIVWVKNVAQIQGYVTAILIEQKGLKLPAENALTDYLSKSSEIEATNSGNGYIEIRGKGLSKGSIFPFLREKDKDKKILAIGDNDNDIELFLNADISVAVANSSKVAIDVADYVCETERGEGFLDMLNVVKAAKKYFQATGVNKWKSQ